MQTASKISLFAEKSLKVRWYLHGAQKRNYFSKECIQSSLLMLSYFYVHAVKPLDILSFILFFY